MDLLDNVARPAQSRNAQPGRHPQLLPTVKSDECQNDFAEARYARTWSHTAPAALDAALAETFEEVFGEIRPSAAA